MSIIAGSGGSQQIFRGQRKDFVVMRGDSFSYTGEFNYVTDDGTDATYDFTGCIGAMMIKKKKTDTIPVIVPSVTFDGTEYTFAVDADDMKVNAGRYVYDFEIYDADSNYVTKIYGNFTILQNVTEFENPLDEDIYVTLQEAVAFLRGERDKYNNPLTSGINVEHGERQKIDNVFGESVGIVKYPADKKVMVMSMDAFHTLVTQYFKAYQNFTNEISYMRTEYLSVLYIMKTEISYSMFYTG